MARKTGSKTSIQSIGQSGVDIYTPVQELIRKSMPEKSSSTEHSQLCSGKWAKPRVLWPGVGTHYLKGEERVLSGWNWVHSSHFHQTTLACSRSWSGFVLKSSFGVTSFASEVSTVYQLDTECIMEIFSLI